MKSEGEVPVKACIFLSSKEERTFIFTNVVLAIFVLATSNNFSSAVVIPTPRKVGVTF